MSNVKGLRPVLSTISIGLSRGDISSISLPGADIILKLLPVLDDFSRAHEAMQPEIVKAY